jgi:hypothetical protein
MYHRVGPDIPGWAWSNSLTIPTSVFEDHLRWLRSSGYHTATLDELHAHMSGELRLPERSVVLTFDDGYVDSWTHVAPLLTKYGFRGVVAVVPEFVDPRDVVRPTLGDVWAGRLKEQDLNPRAFMSWPELRAVRESGVLEIISHSLTHTWWPTGADIVDFHHPGDDYYWLDWNHTPDRKPFYLERPAESTLPWGTPVYENGRALGITRYYPDPDEASLLSDVVASKGGRTFFEQPGWRDALLEAVREWRGSKELSDRHETADERAGRYRREFLESKRIIEERVGEEIRHFLWPGQVFNNESMEMASAIYVSLDASVGESYMRSFNRPGDPVGLFRRGGVPDIERDGMLFKPGGRYFVACLDEFRGVPFARRRRQLMKVFYLAAVNLGWKSPARQKTGG